MLAADPGPFVLPTEVKATPVNFINGSFQSPALASTVYYKLYDMSAVSGWNTIPVNSADYSNAGANKIEIQKVRANGASGFATTSADGTQYAELNADLEGRLYQVLDTVPGARLYWQFAHRARKIGNNTSGTGVDVLNFYLRPSGTPTTAPLSSQLIYSASSNALAWYYYRGVYTVPSGQTSTEFDFMSVSSATGNITQGNFLDDITFQTGSSLIVKKSITTSAANGSTALSGENVTVSVDITNWGETDASRCVFNDVLDDGLTYVADSAEINGSPAGSLATFNSTTDTLRVNFGTGATAGTSNTNGGIVEGSQSTGTSGTTGEGETVTITFTATVTGTAGTVIENQASVSYNDLNFESYNSADFTAYSSVAGETPTSGDDSTYVNRFTVVDRSLDGTVWVDMNGDGMLDSGESKIPGVTVGLYASGDTTYTTPVNDINGNALTATTDANGNYSFLGITSGTYKVVMNTPANYNVTLRQTGTDNLANADGVNAVTTTVTLSSPLTLSNVQDNASDIDLGFEPVLTIAKTAQVNLLEASPGTVSTPVNVNVDDTVTYILTVANSGIYSGVDDFTVTDTLPAGLTLLTDAGSYTAGMTTSTDPVSGLTTVAWETQSLASISTETYTFTATVAKPVEGSPTTYDNSALLSYNANNVTSNYTYHSLSCYTLMLSNLVNGDMADPEQTFPYVITLSGAVSSLSYTGISTILGVDAPVGGTITSGGTIILKHGQGILISGVYSGTDYTITGSDVSNYGLNDTGDNSVGTVTNSDLNVQFVNSKNTAVPSGIHIDTQPNFILVALAAGLLILFLVGCYRRKHHFKER